MLTKIKRIKTNSKNEYKVNDQTFASFGQGVPDEITKILNISPLNIQQQMDSPFLLDDTPGEVAKALNNAVNLDGIDSALSNINKKQKDTRDDIKAKKTSIDSLRMDLDKFDYLEQMESDISILVELEKRLDTKNDQADSIDTILIQHKKITAEQAELGDFLQIEPDICLLQEKAQEQADTAKKAYDLKVLLLAIEQRGCEIAEFTIITDAGDSVDKLIALDKQHFDIVDTYGDLGAVVRMINNTKQNIEMYTDNLKQYEDKFHELMPDECPFGECVVKGKR